MVSTLTPSTSIQDECVRGEDLENILHIDPDSVCILDCRAGGPAIKYANRVRLPNVLFRRLQQGSLALSNVCPRLSYPSIRVVLIPGMEVNETAMLNALSKALRKECFMFGILLEPIDSLINNYPSLFCDKSKGGHEKFASDVGCLNLNSLRIEPESRADKRQIFPVQILPHLYLGNAETARNMDLLETYGIHHIINVTSNLPNEMEDDERFNYLRISVDDNSSHNLIQFFPEAIRFINSAESSGDACLVHCLAGISRSVTVCLAYLMATRRCTLEDAYDVVLRRNAAIAPNFHFMGQLTDYERHLGLKSSGVGTYNSGPPRSPSCSVEAAVTSGLLTPPPTSCSASPQNEDKF
ncbi:unnamed protein product [Auanema sp. JU1783]|nr:unnamed protein product [Auanema sp. JU1783]